MEHDTGGVITPPADVVIGSEGGAGAGQPVTAAGFGCTCVLFETGADGTVPHGVCNVCPVSGVGVGKGGEKLDLLV